MDLTATFMDLAGISAPEDLDGGSLLPMLRGESAPDWRREVFMEFHGHQVPYPQRTIRTEAYKLIANLSDLHEFYDLAKDPDELVNLIDDPDCREIKADLYARLCGHLRRLGDVDTADWLENTCDVGYYESYGRRLPDPAIPEDYGARTESPTPSLHPFSSAGPVND